MSEEPTRLMAAPVIESLARGEIDIQIRTAKQYPRDVQVCREKATQLATLDEDTAAACMYGLKRKKKDLATGRLVPVVIEGPSVRLAEIIACTWTNLRVATRVLGEDGRKVTAQAVCHDLEGNVAISRECSRSITRSGGGRFSADMVTVTENAAASVALRNAVFACVPKAVWQPVYLAARQMAIGDADTLAARRAKLLGYFAKMGIDEGQILALQERESVDELTLEDVGLLRGIAEAIKAGETKVDEAFPPTRPESSEAAAPLTLDAVADRADERQPKPIEAALPKTAQAAEPPATPTDEPGEGGCSKKTYDAITAIWLPLSGIEWGRIRKAFKGKPVNVVDVQQEWTERHAAELLAHLEENYAKPAEAV